LKERGETSGTSKPSGPVYVEVVKIYQNEYTTSSPTPGTQQAQAQTQQTQAQTQTQPQEQTQTRQAGTTSPTDILEKRSNLLQSTLESWYAKQDYIITQSGLISKMRALFGVEPVYSNITLSDSRRLVDAYATLERYKETLSAVVADTMLIVSLVLERLTRQYSELQKKYPSGALRGYDTQVQEISKDFSDLMTLYDEIDKVKMPPVGDENELKFLVNKFLLWTSLTYMYYSKYKDEKIDTDTLAKKLKEQVDEKKDPNLEVFGQSLTLLQDKNKLKDMLARFFVLMDYTRSETYDMYMNTYRSSIESLIKVINDQATYIDFWNALLFVHVLMEMEAKGWLDYKKQLGEIPERRWEYHVDPSQILKKLDQKYQEKLSTIEKGQVPPREPAPTVVFAEWVGVINPLRYVSGFVYNSLRGVFGDAIAGGIASAAAGATGALVSILAPPVAAAIFAISITDVLADVGSRLQNPIDREILAKYVTEHWTEILINIAIAVTVAVATGYVASKIKPYVADKLAKLVDRFSPSIAEKIRSHFGLVKGKPIYESEKTIVTLDPEEKTLHIYFRHEGEIKDPVKIKIPKRLEQYLDDPELKLKVGMIAGNLEREQVSGFLGLLDKVAEEFGADGLREAIKIYLNKLNAGQLKTGVSVYFQGTAGIAVDNDGLVIFDFASKKMIAISKSVAGGEKFYPMIEIMRQDPTAFVIYYLARVYNIKPETLLEKLSPYLNAIKGGGKPMGEVVVGDLKFVFTGEDKLFVLLPKIDKPVMLSLKDFNPNSLLGLVQAGKELAKTYGNTMHDLVLDTLLFGYRTYAPQIPDLVFNFKLTNGNFILVAEFSKILPKPVLTSSAMLVTKDGVVYVSNQLLEGGFEVSTLSTIKTIKDNLKLRFTQDTAIIVNINNKMFEYLNKAILKGHIDESAITQAISMAKAAGDNAAVAELMKLQAIISLAKQNLANIPLSAIGTTGGETEGVVVATMSRSLASASNAVVQQLQQGNAQQAQMLLQQALVESGLSSATARQLAQSIIQSMIQAFATEQKSQKPPTTTAPQEATVTIPRTESKRGAVVVPVKEYTTEERSTREKATGRAVIQPKYITTSQSKTVAIPSSEYTTEERSTREKATGRAVIQPKYITTSQSKTVAIPSSEYTTEERQAKESARGRVIFKPEYITVKSKRRTIIPFDEYYVEDIGSREATRGKVYPIIAPLTVPVVIVQERNQEEEEPNPPPPNPPTPAPMPSPWFPPGGASPTPGTPTPSKPPPRGRRQLEELEI